MSMVADQIVAQFGKLSFCWRTNNGHVSLYFTVRLFFRQLCRLSSANRLRPSLAKSGCHSGAGAAGSQYCEWLGAGRAAARAPDVD